jgi:hypothetical protein
MLADQRDILFLIFQFCDMKTHLTLSLVSHQCYQLATSNRLWVINMGLFCKDICSELERVVYNPFANRTNYTAFDLSHLLHIYDRFQNFLPVNNPAFGILTEDKWIPTCDNDYWYDYVMKICDQDEANYVNYYLQLIQFLKRVKEYRLMQFREREVAKLNRYFRQAKYYLTAFLLSLIMILVSINLLFWSLSVDNIISYGYSIAAAIICSLFIIFIPIIYSMFMGVIPIYTVFSRFCRCRTPKIEMDMTNYFSSALMFHFYWIPLALILSCVKITFLNNLPVWSYIFIPVYFAITISLVVQFVLAMLVMRENNEIIASLKNRNLKMEPGYSKTTYRKYLRSVTQTTLLVTIGLTVCYAALLLCSILCCANSDFNLKWSYSLLLIPIHVATFIELILLLICIRPVGTLGISLRTIRGINFGNIFVYIRGITITYPLFFMALFLFPFFLFLGLNADGKIKTLSIAIFSLLFVPLCCSSCVCIIVGALMLHARTRYHHIK